jgi:hypothetical protein
MARRVNKTTLADSPEAGQVLTEIKPHEVSLVDMPAVGEPFIVIKRMDSEKSNSGASDIAGKTQPNVEGGMMTVKKLDTSVVPRPVMKVLDSRLKGVQSMVQEIVDVAKSLPVAKDGNNTNAPAPLVSLVKSTAAELRSLQSPTTVKVHKRGSAESVMSIQDLVKRAEDIEEIKKGNAVSYLMRDQYMSITGSVTEWLTTYVEGIEHDDDGPRLIPSDLNDGVENAASDLEKLADDYPALEEEPEPDVEAEVAKLNTEIQALKKALKSAKDETDVEKKGSKMAANRLKALKSVSSGVSTAADSLSEIIKELEDDKEEEEGGDMPENQNPTPEETNKQAPSAPATDPVPAPEATPEPTQKNTQTNANGETVTNEQLMAALTKFATDADARFTKIEEQVTKATETATKATEEIEKIHRARGDSRGGEADSTTKINKGTGNENKASFHGLLGIPTGK